MFIVDIAKKIAKSTKNSFLESTRKFVLSVPFWVLIVSIVLLSVSIITTCTTLGERYDQRMAKYWQNNGDTRYRQMSVFARGADAAPANAPLIYIDEKTSICAQDVSLIRNSIQAAVNSTLANSGSNKKPDTNGEPSGWTDCYSTSFTTGIVYTESFATGDGETNTGTANVDVSADCQVVAVGGNFRAFHPFEFLSGGFLPVQVSDQNQIVINDALAWKLFFSYDVAGEQVTMLGETYTIIGVVRETEGSVDETVGTTDYRVYMYFSKVENLLAAGFFGGEGAGGGEGEEGIDASSAAKLAITCYEALIPEVVTGVARTDFIGALPSYTASDPQVYVVDNTSRFLVNNVYESVIPLGELDDRIEGYSLPYWERAAILATEKLFFCYIGILLGAVLLVVAIVMLLLKARKFSNENDSGEDETGDLDSGSRKKEFVRSVTIDDTVFK